MVAAAGGKVDKDTVTDLEEEEERENVRTLLTCLLDCGEVLCCEIRLLLPANNRPLLNHIADLVSTTITRCIVRWTSFLMTF